MREGVCTTMATVSTVLAVTLLLVCLQTALGQKFDIKDGRRNMIEGNREFVFIDKLLFHDIQRQSGTMFPYPMVKSNDVCYPPNGLVVNMTITAFEVTDRMPKDEGGYAFVTDGGVKSRKVCFHLKTQRGKGYDFTIGVFGNRYD